MEKGIFKTIKDFIGKSRVATKELLSKVKDPDAEAKRHDFTWETPFHFCNVSDIDPNTKGVKLEGCGAGVRVGDTVHIRSKSTVIGSVSCLINEITYSTEHQDCWTGSGVLLDRKDKLKNGL